MKQYKAFIFDLDGTIIDSSDYVLKGFNYALEPHNIQIDWEDIERIRNRLPENLFDDYLTTDEEKENTWKRFAHYSKMFGNKVVVFDGLNEIFKLIKTKGLQLAIWTGRDQLSSRDILDSCDILEHFEFVIGSTDVSRNKPDPEGLNILSDQLKVTGKEMIVIGDHHHDIQGGNSIGAFSIHANWNHSNHEIDKRHIPNKMFKTVEELKTWIEEEF